MLFDANAIANLYKDKNNKRLPLLSTNMPTRMNSGGGGGVSTGSVFAGNVQEALSGTGPKQSSGASRFVNFDRILDVNKEGAGKMAESLVGGTEKKVKAAEEAAAKVKQTAEQKIKEGTAQGDVKGKIDFAAITPGYNPVDEALQKYQGTGTLRNEGLQGTPQTTPAQEAKKENASGIPIVSEEEARKLAGSKYTGPKTFSDVEGYDAAEKAYQDALSNLKGYGQPGGIEAQLNEMYGTAGGTGGSRMDTALTTVGLGGEQKYRDRFGKLAEALDKESYLEKYQPGIEQSIAEGEKVSSDLAKAYQDKLAQLEKDKEYKAQFESQYTDEYVKKEVAKARAEADLAKEREELYFEDGRRKPTSGETTGLTIEQQAGRMGMNVYEWYEAGRPYYSSETGETHYLDEDVEKEKWGGE